MQKYCNLNLGWRFKEGFEEEYITGGKDEEGRLVNVPHTVKEVPYDCFDQTMTCMISTYIRSFQLPDIRNTSPRVGTGWSFAWIPMREVTCRPTVQPWTS